MVKHFRELGVYREAFDAAMRIFECSKEWPKEERYSLTDQIRRSSRSVCEQTWLEFALRCLRGMRLHPFSLCWRPRNMMTAACARARCGR